MKALLVTLFMIVSPVLLANEGACTIDAEKFCSGFDPKGEQVRKCLKDHVHELSPDCKDYHASQAKEVFKKGAKADKKMAPGKK